MTIAATHSERVSLQAFLEWLFVNPSFLCPATYSEEVAEFLESFLLQEEKLLLIRRHNTQGYILPRYRNKVIKCLLLPGVPDSFLFPCVPLETQGMPLPVLQGLA